MQSGEESMVGKGSASIIWGAHASRVLAMMPRHRDFEDCLFPALSAGAKAATITA